MKHGLEIKNQSYHQPLMTRETLSKKTGHMLVLNIIVSLIHSGATLSNVPRDDKWYTNSPSPHELFVHVRLKE